MKRGGPVEHQRLFGKVYPHIIWLYLLSTDETNLWPEGITRYTTPILQQADDFTVVQCVKGDLSPLI